MSFAGTPVDLTNAIAGTAFVSVNGITYQLEGSLAYSPVRVSRETLIGQSGVQGFKEMPAPGVIKGSFRDAGGLTVADFNAMRNVTVVCELANGKIVTGRNMWTVGPVEVDTADAKFEVEWNGVEGSVVEN